jgi:molybdopterin adenylyltransferase
LSSLRVARLTVSDRAHAGVYQDKGGPELERVFSKEWNTPVEWLPLILPDEKDKITSALRSWVQQQIPLILTTGGTGPTPRDITPEATRAVLEKELPGLSEAQRWISFPLAPTAILSRAVAGVAGQTLIINFPGNPKAIAECLPPLIPAIRECLKHLSE